MASTGSNSSVAVADTPPASVDLVVGILSYQDAGTIGDVAAAVRAALARGGDGVTRVVLADGGSTDDTPARARAALDGLEGVVQVPAGPSTVDRLALPYHGVPGKARALHAILSVARDAGARACAVLDGGVTTVQPGWVDALAGPVLQSGVDLVAPYFTRHPFDGALTKGIVRPLFRALYGVRVRQPAAAEFACSARLAQHLLDEDVWDRDGAQVGIDLWLAASAASGNFSLGEVPLGIRTTHPRGEEALDLAGTLAQVVGSLCADLESRVAVWQRQHGSIPVQLFGRADASPVPAAPAVEPERLIESFRLGYRELRDVWTFALPPRTVIELRRLVATPVAEFQVDDELWARIVYDFALGYRLRVLPRDQLLQSMAPLYRGWLASFIAQVRDRDPEAVDARLDRLDAAFEAQKPYLISRWRWPERLR